jgi:hypothetical protein
MVGEVRGEERGRGRRKDLKGGGRLDSKGGGREDFRVRKAQESGRALWPSRDKDEVKSTGKRELESYRDNLLQAGGWMGAWRDWAAQTKRPAVVEVLKFEMRQRKKLLCLFGSGRRSPNSTVWCSHSDRRVLSGTIETISGLHAFKKPVSPASDSVQLDQFISFMTR